jgi:hypothetical protein
MHLKTKEFDSYVQNRMYYSLQSIATVSNSTNNTAINSNDMPASQPNNQHLQQSVLDPIQSPTIQQAVNNHIINRDDDVEKETSVDTDDDTVVGNDDDVEVPHEITVDSNDIILDIMNEEATGKHFERQRRYEEEKAALIGTTIEVGRQGKTIKWHIRSDILKNNNNVRDNQQENVGINNFDFSKHTVTCPDGKLKRINFLDLIIHLWPGNWEQQLIQLNNMIAKSNENAQINNRTGRLRKMKVISPKEFWIWLESCLLLVLKVEKEIFGIGMSQKDMVQSLI